MFPVKRTLIIACLALLLSGCGYNNLTAGDEQVKASWAEVINQYQRRADLIPNLVKTVEGFAKQERDVLVSVTTPSFDIFGLELYLPLLCGGRVVIADREKVQDGGKLAALLERTATGSDS